MCVVGMLISDWILTPWPLFLLFIFFLRSSSWSWTALTANASPWPKRSCTKCSCTRYAKDLYLADATSVALDVNLGGRRLVLVECKPAFAVEWCRPPLFVTRASWLRHGMWTHDAIWWGSRSLDFMSQRVDVNIVPLNILFFVHQSDVGTFFFFPALSLVHHG